MRGARDSGRCDGGRPIRRADQMDAVRAATSSTRAGVVGVGVIDSQGRVRGIHDKRRFVTASVIKAMLLVSYLRKVDHQDRGLTRVRAQPARADDQGVVERRGDVGLLPRWATCRCSRLARRADMDQFCDLLLVGLRALQRARPGEVLLAARAAHPAALSRLRDAPAALDRLLAELGHPERRAPARLLGLLQGRLARHRARGQLVHQASFTPLPRRRLLARGPDGRQPVDGATASRRSRASRAGSCAASPARGDRVQCSVYVDLLLGSRAAG